MTLAVLQSSSNSHRPNWLLLCLVCILLAVSASACTRKSSLATPSSDLQIELEIESPHIGVSSFTIQLLDPSGAPITNADVAVRGDMSHAGMTPALAAAEEVEPGVYSGEIEWSMAGDWIVTVQVTTLDGESVERPFDLSIDMNSE